MERKWLRDDTMIVDANTGAIVAHLSEEDGEPLDGYRTHGQIIAAAPELLEVATQAVNEFISIVCVSQNLTLEEAHDCPAVQGWLAVIAKAKGE